jgi:hypothetical protein
MSNAFIDQKYMHIVAQRLDLPKQVSAYEIKARCPSCGDSQKNRYKRRFSITVKSDGAVCGCFNCNFAAPLGLFLKTYFPEIYNDYKMELYREKKLWESGDQQLSSKTQGPVKQKTLFAPDPVKISLALPISHSVIAKEYLDGRCVPEERRESSFVWVPEFKPFVDKITGKDSESSMESRMVIPLRSHDGVLTGIQSRSFDPNATLRYETHKVTENSVLAWVPKWISYDSPVIVTEGVFDAISVRNGAAKMGTNLTKLPLPTERVIYAWDNEPGNEFVVKMMERGIKEGFRVFLPDWHYKDLNQAKCDGYSVDDIQEEIESKSYRGPRALLELQKWKKGA